MTAIKDINIRSALINEYEFITAIQKNAVQRYGSDYTSYLLKEDDYQNYVRAQNVRVMESQGRLVGYSISFEAGGDLFLYHLFVIVEEAGKGLGKELLGDVVGRAKKLGKRAVTLLTSASAPWNAPYYQKQGFVVLEDKMPEYLSKRLENNIRFYEPQRIKTPLIVPRVAMERLLS